MTRQKFTITTKKQCYLYAVHPEGHPTNGVLTKSMLWAEIVMTAWGMWRALATPLPELTPMQRLRTRVACDRDPATLDALITDLRLKSGC